MNWLTAHFKSPAAVVPDSLMPDLGLSDDEAHDLAVYMLGLKRKLGASSYTPIPRPVDPTPAEGHSLYLMYCSSCHGADGVGAVARVSGNAEDPDLEAIDRPRELLTPSLRNDDTLAVATMILGRENTPMTSLASGQQGIVELNGEEVANVVAFLRTWEYEPPPRGHLTQTGSEADQRIGRELFAGHCAGCHGAQGRDSWAPALNNPEFLAAASDGFLKATVARGRGGTAMRSFSKGGGGIATLTGEQIDDIVSHIRSWEKSSP